MSVIVQLDCECPDPLNYGETVIKSLIVEFKSEQSFDSANDNLFDYLLEDLNKELKRKYGNEYYIDDSVEANRFLSPETINSVDLIVSD